MRDRDGRIMIDAERYCRPGADEDQREGANELGCGTEPTAVSATVNCLQTWFGERMSAGGADFAGSAQNHRSGTYLHCTPLAASKSE